MPERDYTRPSTSENSLPETVWKYPIREQAVAKAPRLGELTVF